MKGNLLEFHKVTHGIHSSTRGYFNKELFNLAHETGIDVPYEYAVSQMDISMLNNDFDKFRKVRPWNPDQEKWSWALRKMHSKYSQYLRCEPLTFPEAIAATERTASPGIFWNQHFKTKGEVLDVPILLRYIHCVICLIALGKTDISLWNLSSPKLHEIRPKKKMVGETPKVRVFMCCDIIYYILGLMLYKRQNDGLLDAAYSTNWSAVGIREEYGGWHDLATILLSTGINEFHAFDVKAMEASIQAPIFEGIYDLRNSNLITRPLYDKLSAFYLRSLRFVYVVCPNGFLCLIFGINPSGQLNTLNDNTLTLEVGAMYSTALHFKTYQEFSDFWDTLRGKLMGDDSIIASHRFISYFVADMASIGFEITLECEPSPLTQSTFLNRGWEWSSEFGMFVARPNFRKMLANLLFFMKNGSWRLTYVKAQALRIKFYPFPSYYAQICKVISYVEKKHMLDMEKEDMDDVISMKSVLATNFSEKQIEFLIFGLRAENSQ